MSAKRFALARNVTCNFCRNGRGNAATAPASKETTATVQPAVTANNFARMEKLPRFDRIRGNRLPRPANQGKHPNEQGARDSILDRIIGIRLFAAVRPGTPRFRLAAASAAGTWMKAVGRIVRLGRTGERGGKCLNGRRGIMGFVWDANRGSDERRKAVAFDFGLGHLGFGARIDQDRAFIAIIARTLSTVAAVLLIAAATIALLIGPLLLIRFFREGWIFPVPVIPVLKRALRTRRTLRPGKTLSVPIVMERPFRARLRGTWLGLRQEAWLRRRRKSLGGGSESVRDAGEIAIVLGLFHIGFALLSQKGAGSLLRGLLRRRDQPEIMFGMLEITFRHDRIARGLRVARQLEIFFADVMGCSTNFHIGAARFVGSRQRIRSLAIVAGAAAHPFITLSWSHR